MAVQEAGQAKQKKLYSPIYVLVIAVIFILWLLMLFMDKAFYDTYGMNISYTYWIYIGSIVMIILIIVLLVAGFPARAPAAQAAQAPAQFTSVQPATPATQGVVVSSAQPLQPEGRMAVVEAEPLVVEAEVVEAEPIEEEEEPPKGLKTKKPRLVEYPKKVPGGVYGDTIVRVDPITKLNLRTLLVRSCMICDRQGKCWEEIQDSITRDDFLTNIECKKGLRDMRGHPTGGGSHKVKKKKLVMKVKPTSESDVTGL